MSWHAATVRCGGKGGQVFEGSGKMHRDVSVEGLGNYSHSDIGGITYVFNV